MPPPRGGGGGVRGQKKVCVRNIGLNYPAPLINFIFCLRTIFLMCVGGWVGRLGLASPRPPPPPPHGRSLSNGLLLMCVQPALRIPSQLFEFRLLLCPVPAGAVMGSSRMPPNL